MALSVIAWYANHGVARNECWLMQEVFIMRLLWNDLRVRGVREQGH